MNYFWQNRLSNSVAISRVNRFMWVSIVLLLLCSSKVSAYQFDIVTQQTKVTIVYDSNECKLTAITAGLLADDIERVCGYRPGIATSIAHVKGNVIIIGSVNSKIISALGNKASVSSLKGKWECYSYRLIPNLNSKIKNALLISGSDFRGTAYGVFDLSAKIGVTPWYWWADATPVQQKTISFDIANFNSVPPSVKYRGIFINDEDWGLQPWAAKTFEPETGDIGPKTYGKVFELLLRLKANLIWPAMHPSTKAFFHYPDNVKTAADYQIVIGSSHAEPMMRNNVSEWNEKTMGPFNYLTNKQRVYEYWDTRVKESKTANAIFSMGMRGVHDSGIEGVKTIQEAIPVLSRIFTDQRDMLKKYINPDIMKVPQAFTAYKEVLEIYDAGLKVPDDITLVWPDDNYGYIQRLNDETESKRNGGSGVYYHVSYWGRPHDYLWLSSTSPGLIREEMTKAYMLNNRNIWVVNVGDIKPAEYNMQLFLDMAYRIQLFLNSAYTKQHLQNWVSANISSAEAPKITAALWKYYQLAFERKPEFMGWSQTEPTTKTGFTAYNHQYYGDQAQQRIDMSDDLERQVKAIKAKVTPEKQAVYYQTVYYPIVSASLMNKKFLYHDKAYLYAHQGRWSTHHYDSLSNAVYRSIIKETDYYNGNLSNGKWANMMSMRPRDLPVYQDVASTYSITKHTEAWFVWPEGLVDTTFSQTNMSLPTFDRTRQKHFFDLFLCRDTTVHLDIESSAPWIRIASQSVTLRPAGYQSQVRIWVDVDWDKALVSQNLTGQITIHQGGKIAKLNVNLDADNQLVINGFEGFIQSNGYISIHAKSYQSERYFGEEHWQKVAGLGMIDTLLEALPLKPGKPAVNSLTPESITKKPFVSYSFYTSGTSPADVKVYTLPTHPLNRNYEMRYAISVDDALLTVVNFKTVGRSEEWKQAVLSNTIMRSLKIPSLANGKHVLKIFMIDPGVILDRILIDLGGLKPFYGVLPETRFATKEKK